MKTRHRIGAVLAAACLLGAGLGWAQGPDPTLVRTSLGEVKGSAADGVAVFKGIPYAAPPVGDLRWREPRTAARWQGVRPATAFGPACNQAEDCLFLNVWKPADARPGAKLPVLVWIPGGAFVAGSGAAVDGSEFAKQGVVVVSINYRLGFLGFFAHPALTKENAGLLGNYGIQDQIEALRWVQANAAAFGGDPGNVTISGESAGAISVGFLMLAPQAKGLYAKAISESTFVRRYWRPLHSDGGGFSGEQSGYLFARKNGIAGVDAAAAKALRALPFSAFTGVGGTNQPDAPLPLIDGKLVTSTIYDGFKAGRQAKVPLLIGGNSDEASLYRTMVRNDAELAAVSRNKDVLLAAYDPGRSANVDHMMSQVITDWRISEGDRAAARIQSKVAPTFVYHFSYTPLATRASSFGAAHGSEIAYAFNSVRNGRTPPDAEGLAIAQSMNRYWAAFAKTGDPGSAGGPAWPRFDAAQEAVMEFGAGGKPVVQPHFHKARLDWVEQNIGWYSPMVIVR